MERNTREFEGRFWQRTFAEILEAYRFYVPTTTHTFGTITRAELIDAIKKLENTRKAVAVIGNGLYARTGKRRENRAIPPDSLFGVKRISEQGNK